MMELMISRTKEKNVVKEMILRNMVTPQWCLMGLPLRSSTPVFKILFHFYKDKKEETGPHPASSSIPSMS